MKRYEITRNEGLASYILGISTGSYGDGTYEDLPRTGSQYFIAENHLCYGNAISFKKLVEVGEMIQDKYHPEEYETRLILRFRKVYVTVPVKIRLFKDGLIHIIEKGKSFYSEVYPEQVALSEGISLSD